MDVIIKYTDPAAVMAEFAEHNIVPATDNEGNLLPQEIRWLPIAESAVTTENDLTGDLYFRVRCDRKIVDEVLSWPPQSFEIIIGEEPDVVKKVLDENGSPTGETYTIKVGGFA